MPGRQALPASRVPGRGRTAGCGRGVRAERRLGKTAMKGGLSFSKTLPFLSKTLPFLAGLCRCALSVSTGAATVRSQSPHHPISPRISPRSAPETGLCPEGWRVASQRSARCCSQPAACRIISDASNGMGRLTLRYTSWRCSGPWRYVSPLPTFTHIHPPPPHTHALPLPLFAFCCGSSRAIP